MSDVSTDIERLFQQGLSDDELFSAANDHEQSAVECIHASQFELAHRHSGLAARIYDRLALALPKDEPRRLFLEITWAKTQLCQAVAFRRAEAPASAFATFAAGEQRLQNIQPTVYSLTEPFYDVIYDWLATMGGLLMNRGVLEHLTGDSAAAIQTWAAAEKHLFDDYIKHVGPEADVECVGKVINLWENMMCAGLALGRREVATQAVGNAMKLYVYWPAHGMVHPEPVVEAVGALFGAMEHLPPEQRFELEDALPDPLVSMINEILADDDD